MDIPVKKATTGDVLLNEPTMGDIPMKENEMVDTKGENPSSVEDIQKEEAIIGNVDKENENSNNGDSSLMDDQKEKTNDCLLMDAQDTKPPSDNYDPVLFTNSPMAVDRMMKDKLLRRIAGALAGKDSENDAPETTNFCVEETLLSSDIQICVEKVGNLQFPLDKNCIEKLIAISSEAKFGLGEKTVVDRSFRNTQVIESKCLDVKISQNSLLSIIDNIHRALNLPADSILKPHLHNMLVYSPGQFFGEHRDSEKLENMVATLLIVLPSPHIGGTLVIKHNDQKYKFRSENLDSSNARCICFFSDCWHEVKKVKCGYRVVLTYNIVLEHGKLMDISLHNKYLEDGLRAYFSADRQMIGEKTKCRKLVMLLNHSYSEHSLKWNLLKGEDMQYARLMCSAAKQLNLTIHLGLVSISQQWISDEYEVNPSEFIDSSETIEYWVDENNKKLPYSNYSVQAEEICFTKETEYMTFTPIEEDFSGPTGNEGATVDFWYKRAAIVLWLQSDSIKAQFELNYQNALNELCALAATPGNETRVKDVLQQVGSLVVSAEPNKNLSELAQLALYVSDEDRALFILSKLGGSIMNTANSLLLVKLQKLYGMPWFNRLLEGLMQTRPMDSKQIVPFINQFVELGGDPLIKEALLDAAITYFIIQRYTWDWQLIVPELMKACVSMKNSQLLEKLLQFLISRPNSFAQNELIKIYLDLKKLPEYTGKLELLREHLVENIKRDIAKIRTAGDWSIMRTLHCDCDACKIVKKFLISNEKVTRIAKTGYIRRHLSSKHLPFDITDEGRGKSVFLVLTKHNKIHVEAKANRSKLNALLMALEEKSDSRKRVLEQPGVSTDEMKSSKLCK